MEAKSITSSAMMVTLFVIMALALYYVPMVSLIMSYVLAVPFIFLGFRENWRNNLAAGAAAFAILALLIDVLNAGLMILVFAVPGIVAGKLAVRRKHWEIILGASLISVLTMVLVFAGFKLIMEIDIMADMFKLYQETMEQMAGDNAELITQFETLKQQMEFIRKNFMPVILLLSSISIVYLNYLAAHTIGKRMKLELPQPPSLFRIHFGKPVGLLFIAAFALLIYFQEGQFLHTIALNLYMLASILLFLDGFSVFYAFMGKYSQFKFGYIMLFFIAFTNSVLLNIFVLTGLFDSLFNYQGWLAERGKS